MSQPSHHSPDAATPTRTVSLEEIDMISVYANRIAHLNSSHPHGCDTETVKPLFTEAARCLISAASLAHNLYESLKAAEKEITKLKEEIEDLKKDAYRDSLTEMYNRRHLDKYLAKYHAEVLDNHFEKNCDSDSAKELSLIIIDLNGFKQINDTFGHKMGDHVLCETAHIIASCIRDDDQTSREDSLPAPFIYEEGDCIRHGGDEFCILLPGVKQKDAEKIACRIARRLKEKTIFASIGIGTLNTVTIEAHSIRSSKSEAGKTNKITPIDFFSLVDIEAMYEAKKRKEKWISNRKKELRQQSKRRTIEAIKGLLRACKYIFARNPKSVINRAEKSEAPPAQTLPPMETFITSLRVANDKTFMPIPIDYNQSDESVQPPKDTGFGKREIDHTIPPVSTRRPANNTSSQP